MRGATNTSKRLKEIMDISIHTPHAGSDYAGRQISGWQL